VFENLPTYRLLAADLSDGRGRFAFGLGHYFDGLDTGEACAHEYAAHRLAGGDQPLRAVVGAPWDLTRRPANLAVSTLTLRHDRKTGRATFPLHFRDPAKVGHAGGLYQVIPVGVFQPSSPAPWNIHNDFDLWRAVVREFAEELRGEPEVHGDDGPVDYETWPFAARLAEARAAGQMRMFVLGLGTDPLTFATDLLTVAVVDAEAYDDLFGGQVTTNAEGAVLRALDGATGTTGLTFDAATVERLVHREPVQAAGAAVLALAWRHRDALLR
jgi:hypothetical protein